MNQQTITGAGTGHRQGVIPSLLALSVQPKMFLNFTVLHPQLCTCLCCSREATKPTPSANHPVTLQSVSYLTPSLQGFLGNLSATLMFLLIQHSSVVQLPVQLQSTVIPSQGKEHEPISSTASRTWQSFPKSKAWMAQISVLAASQAQTSLKSHVLKAARPSDRPTKTYFPDTARQLALSVTYQETEKVSVPDCLLSGGCLSHTNETFLAFSPENADLFHKGKTLTHSFPRNAGEGLLSLSQRLVCARNEKVFSHLSPSHKQKRL